LRPFEIHTRAIPIERFLQRRDNDAGEASLELSDGAGAGRKWT
jgi:hypothetical protein